MAMQIPDRSKFAHWWTLDEASGNRADSIGGVTLSDRNTVTQGTGLAATSPASADFESSNSENLNYGTPGDLPDGDIDLTLGVIFKPETVPGSTFDDVVSFGDNSNTILYVVKITDRFRWEVNGTAAISSAGRISTGNTYLAICEHDAGGNTITYTLYNTSGTQLETDSSGHSTGLGSAQGDFIIGSRWGDGTGYTNFYDGLADELFLYEGIMTSSEKEWVVNGGDFRTFSDLLGQRIIGVV